MNDGDDKETTDMKRPLRLTTFALITLASTAWSVFGCSEDSNEASGPSTSNKGGAASSTGGATSAEKGGSTSTATTSGTTTTSGGSTSQATNTEATGGTTGVNTDTSTTAGGSTSTTSTSTSSNGTPPNGGVVCGMTSAGVAIGKNVPCTDSDPQLCYKTCGPTNSGGWKSETCTNNGTTRAYVEVSACIWTKSDYSCYKVPATLAELDSQCPVGVTPKAGEPCSIPACIACTNSVDGNYIPSGDSAIPKPGWCVCNTDAEPPKWTCGSTGAGWPCPGAAGC